MREYAASQVGCSRTYWPSIIKMAGLWFVSMVPLTLDGGEGEAQDVSRVCSCPTHSEKTAERLDMRSAVVKCCLAAWLWNDLYRILSTDRFSQKGHSFEYSKSITRLQQRERLSLEVAHEIR